MIVVLTFALTLVVNGLRGYLPNKTHQRCKICSHNSDDVLQNYKLETVVSSLNSYDDFMGNLVLKAAETSVFCREFESSYIDNLSTIADGIENWRNALINGCLPENDYWLEDPLRAEIVKAFMHLGIPKLAHTHPDLIHSVLRGLLELVIEYSERLSKIQSNKIEADSKESLATTDWNTYHIQNDDEFNDEEHIIKLQESSNTNEVPLIKTMEEELAQSLMRQFTSKWAPPLGALDSLDAMYGSKHGLMSTGGQSGISGGGGEGQGGFGLFDGIWSHTGWTQVRKIQQELKQMKQLQQLVRRIGRRPSVEGTLLSKIPPQRDTLTATMGVRLSPTAPIAITGLRRSDSLERMLSSEAMLLSFKGSSDSNSHSDGNSKNNIITSNSRTSNEGCCDAARVGDRSDVKYEVKETYSSPQPPTTGTPVSDNGTTGSRKRKLLFLAKMAEKSLVSYELAGWQDQNSQPKRKPWKHFQRVPTASGGPIIVCLDTSWSMAGPRESLAKAVVLECSKMAAKEGRGCFVLAFSGAGNVATCELKLGADKKGLPVLLNFLGMSFRGGTDVTTPLIKAIDLIESTMEWGSSDLLLVTDGELQTPPVPSAVMKKLRR